MKKSLSKEKSLREMALKENSKNKWLIYLVISSVALGYYKENIIMVIICVVLIIYILYIMWDSQ